LLVLAPLLSCTDAGLYAAGRGGASGPDRVDMEGVACVPIAAGDAFPVKVLFAVQGGQGVAPDVVAQVTDALNSVSSRFSTPYIKFSLVAYHSVATGLLGSFGDATALQGAIAKYAGYQEQGPISARAPLMLARSLLSGDMQTGCKGTVGRTRYLVILVMMDQDTACANPAFNAGLDSRCTALTATADCSACELNVVTANLKSVGEQYGAGEVTVQPIYVRTLADPVVSAMNAAVARAGGTQPIETDPSGLNATLNGINYASLQRALKLKRVIAFNRNTIARAGALEVDSDGDGIPDANEAAAGLDPARVDTDSDGLMDGVELRMGMDPRTPDVINGCNPFLDTDADRLNDCEERVLGTDACVGDTDGDGIPDLVEVHAGANALVPEDLADMDRDGITNIDELLAHTDGQSADLDFKQDRGYTYAISAADPTEDGRECFNLRVSNVSLVPTIAKPNPPFADIPKGTNDIYLYVVVGRESEPHGHGVSSLRVDQVIFTPPATKKPVGTLKLVPEDFVLGY
jgi:hypothetical protein